MTVHRHHVMPYRRAPPLPRPSLAGRATPFIGPWRRARPPPPPPSPPSAIPHAAGATAQSTASAAACAPHLAALPLVGALTAQTPRATGAVAPRGARALAPTAPMRTGKAAAAAAATAGVACSPEPATTVLAVGASARAGLRVGEQSLPPVGVHVAALLGAVLTAPSARFADGAGAAAVPAERRCSRRPRRRRRRRQPCPRARRHGGLPTGRAVGEAGRKAMTRGGGYAQQGKWKACFYSTLVIFFCKSTTLLHLGQSCFNDFFHSRLRRSPWCHRPKCTGRLCASSSMDTIKHTIPEASRRRSGGRNSRSKPWLGILLGPMKNCLLPSSGRQLLADPAANVLLVSGHPPHDILQPLVRTRRG